MIAVTRSGLWLFLGAFALLGLFAMHGLGGHGVSHGEGRGATHHAESSALHGLVEHGTPSAAGAAGAAGPVAACGADCGEGNALVMTLCLAVLAAGIAVLAFVLHRQQPALLRPPRWFGSTRQILRTARGPGPPGRFALSVQRC